ncbi:hypothetical protein GTP46_28230 [Duganella sp. FT135W]|uniref:Uncharacterized protein n=1 Tax=Duganella flavida TaxID=2692175 RepID=A0A6L8KGK8_9BURK|nr:hypothetical protein [Duganella flavida]MYM26519.1 hypothetical protein [Duganella flavida]
MLKPFYMALLLCAALVATVAELKVVSSGGFAQAYKTSRWRVVKTSTSSSWLAMQSTR